jgi:2-amino-4-hydroxy-6-hydroxymethyldihydropteridine diphosphokinase
MAELAHWITAYVALGSNLDDPPVQIARAFDALAGLPQTLLVLRSPCYRSRPLGPVEQPDFVNAVAGLLTRLAPMQMLAGLKQCEARLGRSTPVVRWGPRRIDLDLLTHGAAVCSTPELSLPHPGIAERAFVLRPWADIAGETIVPGLGRVATLARSLDCANLERLPE